MAITLEFNGVDPSVILGTGNIDINEINGRGPISRDTSLLTVPGRDGAYLQRVRTPVRYLEVAITVRGTDIADLRKKVDQLNDFFVTDGESSIKFSDEDRTYYGVLSDDTSWSEIRNFGQGTLKFVCPDPFKYGPEQFADFGTDDALSLFYGGSEEADPIFEFDIIEDTTVLLVADDRGNYMGIGAPYSVSQTPYEKETAILVDSLTSMTGWTPGTTVDQGAVTGTMSVSANGQDFVATDYGTGSQWHGPAVKQGLSEPLQDFRAEIFIWQEAHMDPAEIGRAELYLLDVNGNTVAKLAIQNPWVQNNYAEVGVRLGGTSDSHYMVETTGRTPIWWNNFTSGIIRLERTGNYFFAYVADRISGTLEHFRPWWTGYTDVEGKYAEPIAQVQLHLGAYGTYKPTTYNNFNLVRVYRKNPEPSNSIPYVARAGDRVTFDHKTRDIRVNGESRLDLKDFGGKFFGLAPGDNSLAVAPAGVSNTTVKWSDKYR